MSVEPFTVSMHAAQRYCERLNPALTPIEAIAAIRGHSRAIAAAVAFGCRCVKVAGGGRLILDGADVVTVLAPRQMSRDILPSRAA